MLGTYREAGLSQDDGEARSELSPAILPQTHESFNLRDSMISAPNAMPLSEQIQNLGFFEKIAEKIDANNKSYNSYQPAAKRDTNAQDDHIPHFFDLTQDQNIAKSFN